jgi:hypothetical protein
MRRKWYWKNSLKIILPAFQVPSLPVHAMMLWASLVMPLVQDGYSKRKKNLIKHNLTLSNQT